LLKDPLKAASIFVFLSSYTTSVHDLFRNASTITIEHLVAYSLHPSYKRAKLSPDQFIIVTDSVTPGSYFPISSQKKGFLCSKNPFLPIGREEIPFFREETQP